MTDLAFLAHAGEGATWQALVTTLGLGVMVVFLLVLVGRIRMEQPDDALLPLAGVAVLAALAPSASEVLSDWIGWALPAGVVVLVAMAIHLFSPLELRPTSPLTLGAVLVAAVGGLLLYQPIVDAWHPPLVFTAQRDDADITILAPSEDDSPIAGELVVEVEVTGGTLVPNGLPPGADVPSDPEELMALKVLVDGFPHTAQLAEDCTVADPCTTVTFPIMLDAGQHSVTVELLTAEGITFEQVIFDHVEFEVLPAP